MDAAINIQGLTKSYGRVTAVDHVDLQIARGELFGLIGPDGAGKTTLFRMLTTLLLPDEGVATLDGLDIVKDYRQLRKMLGYMPGRFSLYQDLSVEENLKFFATIFGTTIEENYDLIRDIYIQIEPFKDRPAGKLSGGMKQKLALSCALIHKPSILILDEPTTGVDAISRKEFWEMLHRLKKEDITIMVSTPYMDEASLCDRIALFQSGRIMSVDYPVEIPAAYTKKLWALRGSRMYLLLQDVRLYPGVDQAYLFGQYIHLTIPDKGFSPESLTSFLLERGHDDIEIRPIEPGIEDCFIENMSQQLIYE